MKIRHFSWGVIGVCVLLVAILLVACAQPATPTPTPPTTQPTATSTPTKPATSPTPTQPTASPTPTQAKTVIKLKYHSINPRAGDYLTDQIMWWAQEVEKRSGAKIEFEEYYSSSLVKATEVYTALGQGIFDIAYVIPGYYPAQLPLGNLHSSLPALSTDPAALAYTAIKFAEWGPGKAEIEKGNMVNVTSVVPDEYQIMGKKRLNTLDAIKGYRARTYGLQSTLWSNLGGVPVNLTSAEITDALTKGTVDGVMWPFSAFLIAIYHVQDITSYLTILDFGGGTNYVPINKDKWNTIPANIQKVMLEVGQEMPAFVAQQYKDANEKDIQLVKSKGLTVDVFSDKDKAAIQASAKTVWQSTVKDLDGKGQPGTQALELIQKLISEYEAAHPKK